MFSLVNFQIFNKRVPDKYCDNTVNANIKLLFEEQFDEMIAVQKYRASLTSRIHKFNYVSLHCDSI